MSELVLVEPSYALADSDAISQLVTCDRIHLLPGWEKSRGANEEKRIAELLGMTITFEPGERIVGVAAG